MNRQIQRTADLIGISGRCKQAERLFFALSCLLVPMTVCFIALFGTYFNLHLFSLDGAFQTYTMLQAIDSGGQVGFDFFPYLSPGLAYAIYPLFKLLGGTLWASILAAHLLAGLGLTLTFWTLLFFTEIRPGLRGLTALLLTAFLAFLAYNPLSPRADINLLFLPGNSLRCLRWLLPVMSSLLLYSLASFTWQHRLYHWIWASAAGVLGGAQLFWAPDAAVASMIVLPVVLFGLAPTLGANGFYLRFVLFTLGAAAGALIAGFLIAGQYLGNWLSYVFVGMREDQFWFFGPWLESRRIFGAEDILRVAMTQTTSLAASLIVVMLAIYCWKTLKSVGQIFPGFHPLRRMKLALLVYVTLAVVGTGWIAQIGGHVDGAYAAAAIPVFLVLGMALALHAFAKPGQGGTIATYVSRLEFKTLSRIGMLSIAVILVFAGTTGTAFLLVRNWHPSNNYASEIGAWVHKDSDDELVVFRQLRADADSAMLAPKQRVFSNYMSALDIVAGASHPSPYGSIIHALGQESRSRHLLAFTSTKYPVVTTINRAYSSWSSWNERASWYFYKELLSRYEPWVRTRSNQHVLWRPRQAKFQPINLPLSCKIARQSNNSQRLILRTAPYAGPLPEIAFAELALSVSLDLQPGATPVLGKRAIIVAKEVLSGLSAEKSIALAFGRVARSYGIGQSSGTTIMAFEHALRLPTVMDIAAFPSTRARLVVNNCTARLFAESIEPSSLPVLKSTDRIEVEHKLTTK